MTLVDVHVTADPNTPNRSRSSYSARRIGRIGSNLGLRDRYRLTQVVTLVVRTVRVLILCYIIVL